MYQPHLRPTGASLAGSASSSMAHTRHAPRATDSSSPDTYAARFRTLVAPITLVGSIATLAALNLPKAAMLALSNDDDGETLGVKGDQDQTLALGCLKGVVFLCVIPFAFLCAATCIGITVAAHLVCVPYALFASAPWANRETDAQPKLLGRVMSCD